MLAVSADWNWPAQRLVWPHPPRRQLGASGLLDSGIAGIVNGNLDLIHFQTYRGNLTYVSPNVKWSTSAGYAGCIDALNMSDYGAGAGATGFAIPRKYAVLLCERHVHAADVAAFRIGNCADEG